MEPSPFGLLCAGGRASLQGRLEQPHKHRDVVQQVLGGKAQCLVAPAVWCADFRKAWGIYYDSHFPVTMY